MSSSLFRCFLEALTSVDFGGFPHLQVPLNQVIGTSGDLVESLTLEPSGAPKHGHSVTRPILNTIWFAVRPLVLQAIPVTAGPSSAFPLPASRERNADTCTRKLCRRLISCRERQRIASSNPLSCQARTWLNNILHSRKSFGMIMKVQQYSRFETLLHKTKKKPLRGLTGHRDTWPIIPYDSSQCCKCCEGWVNVLHLCR